MNTNDSLLAVDISKVFFEGASCIGPQLFDLFARKKKTPYELSLLQVLEEECQGVDLATALKMRSEFGFFILPNLLKENPESFINMVRVNLLINHKTSPVIKASD